MDLAEPLNRFGGRLSDDPNRAMSDLVTSLYFAILGDIAWIKVNGRANCVLGVEFMALIQSLKADKHTKFSLDLRECQLMDSSFLGTLAGLEQDFGTDNLRSGVLRIELVGATDKVTEMIRNLGLDEFFVLSPKSGQYPDQWIPVPPSATRVSRLQCSKMSLDAHEVIVRLNPANKRKFEDVLTFLKEDVKRLEAGEEGAK